MMVSLKVVFVLVGILIASANTASIGLTSTFPGAVVGIWTDWQFFRTSEAPSVPITVTLTEVGSSSIDFSTTTLSFDETTESASFRLRVRDYSSLPYTVSFTINGDTNGQFYPISDLSVTSLFRTIAIDTFPVPIYVGLPTEPLKINLQYPSTADLVFTPTADESSVTFSPSSIIVPAGSLSAAFTFVCSTAFVKTVTVAWSVTGAEQGSYQTIGNSLYVWTVNKRPLVLNTFTTSVLLGRSSTSSYLYTPQTVNASTPVTVTPKAADTTFTPASITFTPGVLTAPFTFNTSTPSSSKRVYFFLDSTGANHYYVAPYTDISIPKRTIIVTTPSYFVLTKKTQISVRIYAPVVADLNVTLFAANVKFSPATVTFTGTTTSAAVEVTPVALGLDSISFLNGGSDAAYYNPIAVVPISVSGGFFFGPSTWYIPPLWVGIPSDKIPVRVNIAPATDVTLTPTSPDLIFTPSSLTFTASNMEQYFTITAAYSGTITDSLTGTRVVDFLVSGGDYTFFSSPDAFTVSINQRKIQTQWSAHLTSTTRYLQKKYYVWATANYVGAGETVTVTPISQYFSFSPSVLSFTSSNTRIEFTATPTAVAGSSVIDYIFGGSAGGLYTPIPSTFLTTAIRPLAITGVVVVPDERIPSERGILLQAPSYTINDYDLASNHVYSIALTSDSVPDRNLTITPRSNHITFNPASITLSGSTTANSTTTKSIYRGFSFVVTNLIVRANFSVTPLIAGVHEVWFELSGADAPYYDTPNHAFLGFQLVTRPVTEYPAISSSSLLLPSHLSTLVAIALAALSAFVFVV